MSETALLCSYVIFSSHKAMWTQKRLMGKYLLKGVESGDEKVGNEGGGGGGGGG